MLPRERKMRAPRTLPRAPGTQKSKPGTLPPEVGTLLPERARAPHTVRR